MKMLKVGQSNVAALFRPHGVGVRFVSKDEQMAERKTAEADGIYTLNGGRFVIAKDDVLPDGAVFEETKPQTPHDEEAAVAKRSQKAAPENKAIPDVPQNKAVKAPERK